MKIMHLLKHSANGNGHVHVAVDLACAQAQAGHRVVLASSGGPYDSLLEAHDVEVVTIPHLGGLTGVTRTGKTLLSHVRRFRPDVMHSHMMTSAVLGFVASKVFGVPLVTTMHNSFDRHSVLMRLGTVVVAVSEAERQLLLSRGYRSSKVVTVLNGPNGSPREKLKSDVVALAVPCIVTLSGLHKRKGVGDIISAFAEVHPEFPDWHLNLIGSGPDRERLEAMILKLDLTGSIHMVGATLTPGKLLQQAQIFASASLAEPFGLAVAEARAAGCAVVATAVGGVPEVVEYGRAGHLTPVSSPADMAAVFRELMADEHALATWQLRAITGVEYFAVDRMARDYVDVYKSVLLPRRGGRMPRTTNG